MLENIIQSILLKLQPKK